MNQRLVFFALLVVLLAGLAFAARLPVVSGDSNNWGTLLNEFLAVSLAADGTLKAGTVGTDQITNASIVAADVAFNAINASHVSAGAINASHISNNAINASHLFPASINATHVSSGVINSTHLLDGTINGSDINPASNLTINAFLTFGLGQMFDNLASNWIRLTGSLNVTQNLTSNGQTGLAGGSATGNNALAVVRSAVASGPDSVAIGSNTTASGISSMAIGDNVTAASLGAHAFGTTLRATGMDSMALGKNVEASGFNSMAIGLGGEYGNATQANSLAIFGGNVGINTSSPDRLFKVNGNSNVTGDAFAATRSGGGIDVAEWIKSEQGLQAGDVVIIDRSASNRVKKSAVAYDSSVAGIVSARPHLLMGTEYQGPDAIPLALAGRVPVKVTDEGGSIRPGDWLTTSSSPGRAMKCALDCTGARVGKALESLDQGTGTIMILVALG